LDACFEGRIFVALMVLMEDPLTENYISLLLIRA
jgi:hypothetical protein